jgi:hypothetical protein
MRKKKAGSDAESEGSGYEEVKVDEEGYSSDEGDSDSEDNFGGGRRGGRGGDSSEDDGFDITDALAGNLPSSSKKGKERAKLPSQDAQFHQAGGKKKNSSYIPGMPESEDDEGDVSDADLIVEMMEKRNVKDGKAVVKSAVAKKGDNGKGMKEATGGGSFPTMGSFLVLLTRFRVCLVSSESSWLTSAPFVYRSSPFSPQIDHEEVQDPYPNPTSRHPRRSLHPSSRYRRHVPNWIRKDPCLRRSPHPTSPWPTLFNFRCSRDRPLPKSRAGGPDSQGRKGDGEGVQEWRRKGPCGR